MIKKKMVTLNPGESKAVSFEVIPQEPKTYQVSVNGLAGSFVAIEAPVAEFIYVSAIRQIKYEDYPGESWSHHCLRIEIDVKNTGDVAGICSVQAQIACAENDWAWVDFLTRKEGCLKEATIQPEETITFYDTTLDSPAYGYTCKVRFTGDPGTTGEVVLPYEVEVSFKREPVCASGYMDENDQWVCIEYFPDEREGIITVANKGAPGQLRTTVEGWLYLEGTQHSPISGTQREWINYFEIGQTRIYSFTYVIPITGMQMDSRFFIKVYDPDGEIIFDKVFITPL